MEEVREEHRELLRRDAEARSVSQREFVRPILLEAGAGTGKTTTLVNRVLAWILGMGWTTAEAEREGDVEPHRIAAEVLSGVVAITFTEAAAAQMATQVAASLAAVATGRSGDLAGFDPAAFEPPLDDETASQRARTLLGVLDHLTVRTFHSYCRSLLLDYPLEAGVHPLLTIDADQSVAEEVARAVVLEGLGQVPVDEAAQLLATLARRGKGPEDLVAALTFLIAEGIPTEALERDPFPAHWVEATIAAAGTAASGLCEAGAPLERTKLKVARELLAAATATVALAADTPETLEGLDRFATMLPELWKARSSELRKWSRGELKKTEATALGETGAALAEAAAALEEIRARLDALDPGLLMTSRTALLPLLERAQREMRSRGAINFTTLLRQTARLVDLRPGVLRRERQRIRQLLVDEFQDTDPIQGEIVRRLALDPSSDSYPGLFVVGDPKQTIFGWREADLAAYEAFKAEILRHGGKVHTLSLNFRSTPAILEEVDRTVAPVMVEATGLQPRFEPLVARRRGERTAWEEAGWSPIEHWVSWVVDEEAGGLRGSNVERTARLEGQAVARDIRKLHETAGVVWQDVALLFRNSNHIDSFLGALRDEGVPFVVTHDRNYYQRREVIEAAALVRAVLSPNDQIALVAWLRSVSVGVPDAALIPLWAAGFPELVIALDRPRGRAMQRLREIVPQVANELPDGIPGLAELAGWDEVLLAALERLGSLRETFAREPSDRFLEALREASLMEAMESARYLGRFRHANLDRFFRHLAAQLADSSDDLGRVLRELGKSIRQAREEEEALPREAAENAVQIMTIHKAKGLQFRHVYLVQLHTRGGGGSDPNDAERLDDAWELVLLGAPTPGFAAVAEKRRAVARAENVRTWYVAMTRAADRLVLVGNWPEQPTPVAPAAAETHMELLQSRTDLPISIRDLADVADPARGNTVRAHGALWRFPGLPEALPPQLDLLLEPPWPYTRADLDRIASRLDRDRTESQLRQARPFAETASTDVDAALEARHRPALDEDPSDWGPADEPRTRAQIIGTAIHEALEEWNLEDELDRESERQRTALPTRLARLGDDSAATAALALESFDRLASGHLLRRLVELAPLVVGREIPAVLHPDPKVGGAVGFVSGVIDLLYRDPETGEHVIVDFKTDRIAENEVDDRSSAYAEQERFYARAVRQALELPVDPRCELWFLWPDCVHTTQEHDDADTR